MTIEDLHARLLRLQVEHAQKKDINKIYRQAGANGLAVVAAKYGQKKADEIACLLKNTTGHRKSPYPRAEFTRIAARIARVERRIRKVEAREPAREPVSGNGWTLREDVVNNCTTLTITVNVSRRVEYALRAQRFKFSPLRGYHRERSREAWDVGLGIGRMLEAAGTTPIDDTQE